jgi:hypothetical protein
MHDVTSTHEIDDGALRQRGFFVPMAAGCLILYSTPMGVGAIHEMQSWLGSGEEIEGDSIKPV